MDENQRKRTLEELYLNNPETTEEEKEQGLMGSYADMLNAKLSTNVKKSNQVV